MRKIANILGGVFRVKTGMPQKIEITKQNITVYKTIEQTKEKIENDAIDILEASNNQDWLLNKAQQDRVHHQFIRGQLSEEELIEIVNVLKNKRNMILGSYIDSPQADDIIISSKNKLYRIKKENIKKIGIAEMDFSTWENIKASAELARSILVQIETSADYEHSMQIADAIYRYQRDKHLRR